MIVIGYPGIGKTTLAKYSNIIDLDSSLFKSLSNWAEYYVMIANYLSEQGNVVMISSHPEVIKQVIIYSKKACMIYPSLTIKNKWIERIGNRLLDDPSIKNLRAYDRVKNYFEEDINAFKQYNIPKCEINSINYNLKDMIDDFKATGN